MIDFSNKNVIVTGGASGIGKAVVKALLQEAVMLLSLISMKKVRDRFKKNWVGIRYRYIRST